MYRHHQLLGSKSALLSSCPPPNTSETAICPPSLDAHTQHGIPPPCRIANCLRGTSLPNSGTDDNLTTQRNPRPATFSSMPDEIILVIFGFVLDGTPPFVTTGPCYAPPQSRPNPEYVRNCYQTCRQFRRVAAELLFTHVPVRRLPSSIERLEKICADPAFCMNTRVVEIDVVLYKQTGNKESFASFIRTQRDRLQRCPAIPFPPSDLQAHLQVAEVAKLRILESWKRRALQARTDLSELPPDHPDFTQQQLLLWMWRRYRQIF